jgi:hypothetical protein
MAKRLIVGLLLGTVIGAVLAAVLVQGLGMWSFAVSGAVFAYLTAAVTGVLTGLVAGKPIWSADGKIEAGLKAFFGALLALGGMFVLRQWVAVNVDLTALKAGAGTIGDLPAASLPLISAILAGFFELDNSGEKKKDEEGKAGADKAADKKVRVAEDEASEDETEEPAEEEPVSAKKKRR